MNCRANLQVLPMIMGLVLSQSTFSANTSKQIFQHLHHLAPNLNARALKSALNAYEKANHQRLVHKPILTVIDYSLPSSKQRMWIFDVKREKLLMNTYVAHGQNSGMNVAKHFSNTPSSKTSSLGTYITKNTYIGSNGLSLNLQGLEKGFNDNALRRRVVIHGAWYVEPSFIRQSGRAGRSWGCPSVAKSIASSLIHTIKGGSVVFAYYPDFRYLHSSHYV
jgi:L,D-transpeptidase catalytic domain